MPKVPFQPQKSVSITPAQTPPSEGEIKQEKKYETPKLLRGMKDVLPSDEHLWNTIYDTSRNLAESYGFGRLRTPILESTKLFVRSVGKGTDIVEKEMYTFEDLDTEKISLRPEATASVVRAYIVHGMLNQPQPVKLWYTGPMFRHERPQAGRYRQFYQVGFEALGSADPVVDAMLINVAYRILTEVGVETLVHINSIGCRECRPHYIEELQMHYRNNRSKLCEDCKKRITRNPLRVLDCKEPGCNEVKQNAPQLVDKLCEPCKKHFMQVLEYCDELAIPYFLNPYLVRGLDYYNRTVFEFVPATEEEGQPSQSSYGGGGRYDYLVETMGGRPTPAAGFAHGIERIVAELHRKQLQGNRQKRPHVFVAQLGELARRKAMPLFEELRAAGFRVRCMFDKSALREQMKIADKCAAPFSFILGQREVIEGTVIIRDMESGIQEIIDRKKVVTVLQKKLAAKEQEIGSLDLMPEKRSDEVPVDAVTPTGLGVDDDEEDPLFKEIVREEPEEEKEEVKEEDEKEQKTTI